MVSRSEGQLYFIHCKSLFQKPGTPVEGEGENEGVQTKHVHHGHKIHRHVEGHESEEAMDSESESVGLPHSDESGEEGEHCGCHFHGVRGHHHVHGHHIHRLHGHGHHELHDGSGGKEGEEIGINSKVHVKNGAHSRLPKTMKFL